MVTARLRFQICTPGFLNCILRFLICIPGFLLGSCSADQDRGGPGSVPFFREVCSLVGSIDESVQDTDYALVRPAAIAIDGNGNVFIADEGRIKIFDPGGQPLIIIGQAGEGPGEFIMVRDLQIGPRGHLAAIDLLWECNVFEADGTFLQKIRYRTAPDFADYIRANSFTFTRLEAVVPLDDDLFLLDLYGLDNTLEERFLASEQLLLAGPETLHEIVQYSSRNTVRTTPGNNVTVDLQGELLWAVIGAPKLVYSHAYHDVTSDSESARYLLHRVPLASRNGETHC